MAAYFDLISLSIIALSLGSRDSSSPYGSDEKEERFPLTIASPPSEPPTKSRRISIDNTRPGVQGMPPSKGAGPSHTLGKADTNERFPAQETQLWEYLLDKLLCPFTDERVIQWEARHQPTGEYMFSIPILDLLTADWNRHHATAIDNNQLLVALRRLIDRGMLRHYNFFRSKSNIYAFLGANAEFKEQYDAKSTQIRCAACNKFHEKRPLPDNLPQIADESASQGGEELWKYIVDLLLCPITQYVVAWDTTPIHHTYQFTIIDWSQIRDRWNLHHVAITYDELLEYITSHAYPNGLLLRIGHADENTYAFNENSRLFRAYYIQQVQNEKCPICTKSHKKVSPD